MAEQSRWKGNAMMVVMVGKHQRRLGCWKDWDGAYEVERKVHENERVDHNWQE